MAGQTGVIFLGENGETVEEVVGVQFHHLGASGRGGVVRILRRSGRQGQPRVVTGEVAGGRGRS
uniref:Uncharacterized protein n=1 Tax=Oryza meridionalis TaxID=40149 RepID=A0A0E0CG59_9ORYZ